MSQKIQPKQSQTVNKDFSKLMLGSVKLTEGLEDILKSVTEKSFKVMKPEEVEQSKCLIYWRIWDQLRKDYEVFFVNMFGVMDPVKLKLARDEYYLWAKKQRKSGSDKYGID